MTLYLADLHLKASEDNPMGDGLSLCSANFLSLCNIGRPRLDDFPFVAVAERQGMLEADVGPRAVKRICFPLE